MFKELGVISPFQYFFLFINIQDIAIKKTSNIKVDFKMSNAAKENIVIFKTNKDKLIEVILNELSFLNTCFYKAESMALRGHIKVTVDTLENLLKIQGFDNSPLSDDQFRGMTGFVRQQIKFLVREFSKEVAAKWQ